MTPYALLLAERFGLNASDPVDRIVASLLADATDRRGWRQEWDRFDDDVKREIVAKWRALVVASLAGT